MITEALVAFTLLLKFPLPAVKQNVEQLTRQLFVLLKDYSKAGAARGENYLLVQNCFKVFAPKCRRNCYGGGQSSLLSAKNKYSVLI